MPLKIIVNGISEGENFTTDLMFTLIPPKEKTFYGNGYYMKVDIKGNTFAWVNVRYSGKPDIKKLANQWIENYFGENAKEILIKEV